MKNLLRPRPAFSQVIPAMADFRPSGFPPQRGLTRTAPFRVGINAFFLAVPARGRAETACITVSLYEIKRSFVRSVTADAKGPLRRSSVRFLTFYGLSYSIFRRLARKI